jgi:phospholipase C
MDRHLTRQRRANRAKGARAGRTAFGAMTVAAAIGSAVATQPALASAGQPQSGLQAESKAGVGTDVRTATPIKHLVVIYQENHSFDNYFGTYPHALNPPGEPPFHAAPGTPRVNGLTEQLIDHNPNLANPFLLNRSEELTCDNNHGYTPLQTAYDDGLVDKFVQAVGPKGTGCSPTLTMGHYDGNTVTGLWEYAQHFAMSDDNFDDTYGPSNPSILNLISGQTAGAVASAPTSAVVGGTLIANVVPAHDDCAARGVAAVEMTGRNIGNLLNANKVSWGLFAGGFKPTANVNGTPVCASRHTSPVTGVTTTDYGGGNDPFQYYPSTANPHHLPPSTPAMIGRSDQANHQYDLSDFWTAADAGRLPGVSFLRAPTYEQGHPGSSDPLDEQNFLVTTINHLQMLPSWRSTAVVITWDESDGWYDHVMPPIVNDSQSAQDVLTGPGACGTAAPPDGFQDRCGYGPRIPELVISPYSRVNFVSHTLSAQSSVIRFIEDNWLLGGIGGGSFDTRAGTIAGMLNFRHAAAKRLFLDPGTGEPVAAPAGG